MIPDDFALTLVLAAGVFSFLAGLFTGAFDTTRILRKKRLIKPRRFFSNWTKGTYTFTPENPK